ncbi:protein phosphatase 2C domain-containing protein [Catellatospora sp. NPDC049609]|uniref:protein phosphatase 2C domain-containing protein n=1 Tax=Catellatospora sp. NPDC049609 TaxID=3155505 RepID=UPI003431CEDE
MKPLLLTRQPVAEQEPPLPSWVIGRCTTQSSYFHGRCGGEGARRLLVRGAALRGREHAQSGRHGQDAIGAVWNESRGVLYLAVADGVGSLVDSDRAAHAAVRQALSLCRDLPVRADFATHVGEMFREIGRALRASPDTAGGATTLVVAEVRPSPGGAALHVTGVGDSEAWLLADGGWMPLHHERDDARGNATRSLPGQVPLRRWQEEVPAGAVLLLASDGFAGAVAQRSPLGAELAARWRVPPAPTEFLVHVDFHDGYRADDRGVLAVWIV